MDCPTDAYAHSLLGRALHEWESLADHLAHVGLRAGGFAGVFGWGAAAEAAGRLHDIGKNSARFQAYIRSGNAAGTGGDHSTAGAIEAIAAYPGVLGRLLAPGIAGHHGGLTDGDALRRRLGPEHVVEPYAGWQAHAGKLPAATPPTLPWRQGAPTGFGQAFLVRMLFSCLVDADWLETERFYARADGEPVPRGGYASLESLRDRLRAHMARLGRDASDTSVNRLRAEVLHHAITKAALSPGLFTLTVPTGGGKTLASLSFALDHAVRHGLRRVIFVIPFTSIIEQTAQVFREALGENDVLEHHASFDWEPAERRGDADDEGRDGLKKLQRATENWDVPVVVTTAVQFFESLFAARRARCRKLHNIAGSVIVLDEAQTLPLGLLRPCMAALDELSRNYRASVVLCTATQPALRKQDGFPDGFDIPDERELAPEPKRLYVALKRVQVEVLSGPVADATIAARFAERWQMLCIVNSRKHARALFEAIRLLPGAVHLSTLMCAKHRRAVLAMVRRRVAVGEPARIVSTSLIEAGVDLDVPEVWRAAAGLDSIAQAAGRCNRNGLLAMGRTVVFEPAEAKPPEALAASWQAARPALRAGADPLSLEAIHAYFSELYWQKGAEALDALRIDGRRGVLPALSERAGDLGFPFRGIADAFRFIEDAMEPVVVPWRSDEADRDADTLLARIACSERPRTEDLRRLQQYVVSVPRRARAAWLAAGALRPAHPAVGEALLTFADTAHYRRETGLDVDGLGLREAELNVW